MNKERLRLIVRNLESLVDALKSEINSDQNSYDLKTKIEGHISDYDEIFDEDNNLDWEIK
jgi:hypothetical protein